MQTFIEIKDKFNTNVCNGESLHDTYVKYLIDIFEEFQTHVQHWRDVVKHRNRILTFNLVYGDDATTDTDISVSFKNIIMYRNLLLKDMLKDKLGHNIISYENFTSNFHNILGPTRMVSLDLMNSSKMNIITNISTIINYITSMYQRFSSLKVMSQNEKEVYLDKLWLFVTLCNNSVIAIRTATSALKNYLPVEEVDYMSMKRPVDGIQFNEIPNDVIMTREEESKDDSE